MGNKSSSEKPLAFSRSGKFTETLGNNTNNSVAFDDFDWIKGKFNYQVAEVKVWHDDKHVHGIQFSYKLDGTVKSPGSHNSNNNKNLKCSSLSLSEGEHIVKVVIRAGNWIDRITLITDKNRYVDAGGNGGEAYAAIAPKGEQFVAVAGATGDHLDNVTFFYDEIN